MIAELIISACGWAAGWWAFGGTLRAASSARGPLPAQEAPAADVLSIIIPARNEENRLERLLASLEKEIAAGVEVIVADDNSTDGTAALAKRYGARVVQAGPLPEGWRGKTWACQRGAAAARESSEMGNADRTLLFLDADTWFEPGGIQKLRELFRAGGGVVSVCPHHEVPRAHEQLSAIFNLLMVGGTGGFTLFPRKPDGLFGQSLMIRAEDYHRVGGHSAVKEHVLENLWLGRQLAGMGVPLRTCVGKGILRMRMYREGTRGVIDGWGKAFTSGAGATAPVVMLAIVLWICGAVTAASLLVFRPALLTGIIFVAFGVQIACFLRRIGTYWLLTAALYPITLFFFFAVFAWSAVATGRSREWKGRAIHGA